MESSGLRIPLTKEDHFNEDDEIYSVLISTDHMDQLCATFRGRGTCSGGDGSAEIQINIFSHAYFRELYTQGERGTHSGWVASWQADSNISPLRMCKHISEANN